MNTSKTICYSGAASKSTEHRLGTPHYSYRFAEQKFLSCFAELGIDARFLAMPEYFSAPMSYAELPTYDGLHVHVMFRSTAEMRILKNGYNIACYAWEFPFIKDTTLEGEHPFLNQKRMLTLCDEIWVPCEYTKSVLDSHGLENVHVIPAPIAGRGRSNHQSNELLGRLGHLSAQPFVINFLGNGSLGRNSGGVPLYTAFTNSETPADRKVFLSIFNPEDFRKNLDALVRRVRSLSTAKRPGRSLDHQGSHFDRQIQPQAGCLRRHVEQAGTRIGHRQPEHPGHQRTAQSRGPRASLRTRRLLHLHVDRRGTEPASSGSHDARHRAGDDPQYCDARLRRRRQRRRDRDGAPKEQLRASGREHCRQAV